MLFAKGGSGRRGLAPLELALVLPFLLMIMCLMINIGTEAKWKIRSLVVSRQAVWRQRGDRIGATDPVPAGWPSSALLAVAPAPSPPLFPQDPFANYPVVRGAVLSDPQYGTPQSQLFVDTTKLDLNGNVEQGVSAVDRSFPVFTTMGGVHLKTVHLLADRFWRFQELGYDDNLNRRIRLLYQFLPSDQVRAHAQEYQQAAMAILGAPLRQDLVPLYNDEELLAWYGAARDFRPWIREPGISGRSDCFPDCPDCTLNALLVRAEPVQQLLDRVQGPRAGGREGVPEIMARAFIQMYQDQIDALNAQTPPPNDQIAQLQQKVDQLRRFLGTLD